MKPASSAESPHARDALYQRRVARSLRESRARAGLSLRELARRAGTSHATLSAYEQARKSPAVTTYFRILEACGLAIDVETSPRIREHRGLDRGEELAQVLELAEAFPARHSRIMTYPPFGRKAVGTR